MCACTDNHVRLATRTDYRAIRALILRGLAERWTSFDPELNPDLANFGTFYDNATVLTAKHHNRVIGCGILVREAEHIGRIVRMSVALEHRRSGVGSRILDGLLVAARTIGYREIVLETTASWESAVRFYRRNGFTAIEVRDGNQHFCLALSEA